METIRNTPIHIGIDSADNTQTMIVSKNGEIIGIVKKDFNKEVNRIKKFYDNVKVYCEVNKRFV